MNRDQARYQYQSQAPQQALQNYMAMIQGNYGGTTTSTVPKQGGLGSIIGSIAPLMMGL